MQANGLPDWVKWGYVKNLSKGFLVGDLKFSMKVAFTVSHERNWNCSEQNWNCNEQNIETARRETEITMTLLSPHRAFNNLLLHMEWICFTFSFIVNPFSFITRSITIHHDTVTIQFSLYKLSCVFIFCWHPPTKSMSLDFAIHKLSFIKTAICHYKFAMTLNRK